MPKGFDNCAKGGGQVRTVTGPSDKHDLKEGEYRHVCFDKSGMHRGYKKRKGKVDEAVEKGTKD